MKRCCTCKVELPQELFCKNKSQSDGLSKQCKSCSTTQAKSIRLADRLETFKRYSNGDPKCACCGEHKFEFLAIDHIYGGGKKHITEIGFNLSRWLKSEGYPDGYRILCHNCNMSLGFYGYCPHHTPSELLEIGQAHCERRKGPRSWNGVKSRFSLENVMDMQNRKKQGESSAEIALAYKTSVAYVNSLIRGESGALKHKKG